MDYIKLSEQTQKKIISDRPYMANRAEAVVRRKKGHEESNFWRPPYIKDCEKILNCPYYNRYSDKTQVFSFYKNDDISRRSLHVQLVSRIARNISSLLDLNCELTEAIALGHDIGHPPFGHAGEACLNKLSKKHGGKSFMHNLHSVRVLDKIFPYNISLDTLDGILCHNGELPLNEYIPSGNKSFENFDENVSKCYTDEHYCAKLVPSTLEGCVVRISDLIAYIGKDRQDAIRAKALSDDSLFTGGSLGKFNAAIINNMIVNIVENSYGKSFIKMDSEYYADLKAAMEQNYKYIYLSESVKKMQDDIIAPMYERIFEKLLSDVENQNTSSVIFSHHIKYINKTRKFYTDKDYLSTNSASDIVVDFVASMTDDYFSDLYEYLFPNEERVKYISYFEGRK